MDPLLVLSAAGFASRLFPALDERGVSFLCMANRTSRVYHLHLPGHRPIRGGSRVKGFGRILDDAVDEGVLVLEDTAQRAAHRLARDIRLAPDYTPSLSSLQRSRVPLPPLTFPTRSAAAAQLLSTLSAHSIPFSCEWLLSTSSAGYRLHLFGGLVLNFGPEVNFKQGVVAGLVNRKVVKVERGRRAGRHR
ncbi:hypothetical protein JCM6882_008484 [Rhodosporidiobolus microsporus]